MDEPAARDWLTINVPRETLSLIEQFVEHLRCEMGSHNLISRASAELIWSRHVVDSAQLARLAPPFAESWVDLGTGSGFPGVIVALLHPARMTLIEERGLRADFLSRAVDQLGLSAKVEVIASSVQKIEARSFDVISARAFAPLNRLLALGHRFAAPRTRWVLPKGKNASDELAAVKGSWHGEFRLEPSLTDPAASIIVADQVRPGRRETT